MQYRATSAPANLNAPIPTRPLLIGVAGGTGFVGSELITRLVGAGHSVRVPTRNAAHADQLLPLSSVEIAVGNVYNAVFLRRCFEDCDVIINLVGVLNSGGAGFRRAHVEFTAAVLQAMQQARVQRLLHMSALNADAERGRSHYLRTKGQAEQLVRAASGLEWTIFRPSVIFGAQDSLTVRFASLLRLSAGLLPLARPGARFAPIYVGDVVTAFMRALGLRASFGATYELCGPEVLTLNEIVRLTAQAAQLPCHVLPLPDAVAWLQGALMQLVPGKPFSLDNYHSLLTDSVCRDHGCEHLGLDPASFSTWIPLWLRPKEAPPLPTS
ncbi:MAG: complex I NDUFA9 subunit family protein [Steroidobacterales bacterium]